MTSSQKNNLYLALLFVAATAVMTYFMPRDTRHRYFYEENRPWNYALLTAPFDITVYRDSATVQQMIDSIDRVMVPIYRRDVRSGAAAIAAVNASEELSASTKSKLAAVIRDVYAQGIVDAATASMIARGELPEVKFNENNVNITYSTEGFLSQRGAYLLIDSIFDGHAEHSAIHGVDLGSLLHANISEDREATAQYRESLIQPVVAGIGVIQKGERIISQGDIVTPQIFQVLKSYESTLEKQNSHDHSRLTRTIVGQCLYTMVLLALLFGFMALYYPKKYHSWQMMLSLILLEVSFFVVSVFAADAFRMGLYLVPLAIVPVIVTVFFDSRTAFFYYVVEVLLCSMLATNTLEFIFIELSAGTAVVFSLKDLSRRSELLRSAAIAFAVYIVAYVAMELLTAGTLSTISWRMVGFFAVNALLISFAYLLIFIIEKVFGMTSMVTLVELADINTPLLRRLSMECPGTFQHSMAVSNLATDAANRIGANVQLVRAGALYHDIGKIENPAFFTENQHGANPHDVLEPKQSARIIISHITDGLRLADKAKLPRVIRDLITQHHGRGRAKYFYTTYCNAHPEEKVDPEPFTYPGPNPQTREASLLMMADTVEAASRSLTDHSETAIRQMVDRLIDAQVADGLHSESPLSFRDISEIKDAFVARLRSMYHARISYPTAIKPAAVVTDAADDDDASAAEATADTADNQKPANDAAE